MLHVQEKHLSQNVQTNSGGMGNIWFGGIT